MARRILPSAATMSYHDSISRLPASLAGAPPAPVATTSLAPTSLAPTSLAPTSLVPAPTAPPTSLSPVPARLALGTLHRILIGVICLLVAAVIVLATCLAHAQGLSAPTPSMTSTDRSDVPASTPATNTAQTPTSSMTEPTSHTSGRRGAASAATGTHSLGLHDVQFLLVALAGIAIGRRTARRAKRAAGSANGRISEELEAPRPPARRLGAASITGAVRETNQDRVAVARIAGLDIITIADGLGGLPRGGEAAELVVGYVMDRLEAELPTIIAAREDGVRTLLLHIIWGAAMELACVAARETWSRDEEGLRTTLVIVVASADRYVSAWIGDGGVFILREGGSVVALVEPHKNPATPDLLDASLGPVTEGRPSWAIAPRYSGDTLVGATDGIADLFDDSMAETVRDALSLCHGDAADASHKVVECLAALRDDAGNPPITDNLTLAILTTEGAS